MARALIPLADGVEETEAVILTDVLRRGRWRVVTAGLGGLNITASRGVRLVADALWTEVDPASFDVLLIPGGRDGTDALRADDRMLEVVRTFVADGKLVGAICAGPLVLQQAGVLSGLRATCHPGVRAELNDDVLYTDERVVFDGGIATSQGPGSAFEFALALIERLDGSEAAHTVAGGLTLP